MTAELRPRKSISGQPVLRAFGRRLDPSYRYRLDRARAAGAGVGASVDETGVDDIESSQEVVVDEYGTPLCFLAKKGFKKK